MKLIGGRIRNRVGFRQDVRRCRGRQQVDYLQAQDAIRDLVLGMTKWIDLMAGRAFNGIEWSDMFQYLRSSQATGCIRSKE